MSEQIGISKMLDLIRRRPGDALFEPDQADATTLGLETVVCDALVDALVAARVLRKTPTGASVSVDRSR